MSHNQSVQTVHEEQMQRGKRVTDSESGRSRSPPPPGYFDHECLPEVTSSQLFLPDILRSMAWVSDP